MIGQSRKSMVSWILEQDGDVEMMQAPPVPKPVPRPPPPPPPQQQQQRTMLVLQPSMPIHKTAVAAAKKVATMAALNQPVSGQKRRFDDVKSSPSVVPAAAAAPAIRQSVAVDPGPRLVSCCSPGQLAASIISPSLATDEEERLCRHMSQHHCGLSIIDRNAALQPVLSDYNKSRCTTNASVITNEHFPWRSPQDLLEAVMRQQPVPVQHTIEQRSPAKLLQRTLHVGPTGRITVVPTATTRL